YLTFGAAIATVSAFAVRWGATYYFSQRLWRVEYRWAPVARQFAIGVAVCVVSLIIPPAHGLIRSIALHLGLFLVYLLGVWHLGVLSDGERAQIRELVRTRRISALSRAL